MRRHSTNIQAMALHLTRRSNLDAISEFGLLPAIGANSKLAGETIPAVYCFINAEAAETALLNWAPDLFDESEPIALLGVDVTQMTGEPDHDTYEIAFHVPIAPSRITILADDLDEAMQATRADDLGALVVAMLTRYEQALEAHGCDLPQWVSYSPLVRWQVASRAGHGSTPQDRPR